MEYLLQLEQQQQHQQQQPSTQIRRKRKEPASPICAEPFSRLNATPLVVCLHSRHKATLDGCHVCSQCNLVITPHGQLVQNRDGSEVCENCGIVVDSVGSISVDTPMLDREEEGLASSKLVVKASDAVVARIRGTENHMKDMFQAIEERESKQFLEATLKESQQKTKRMRLDMRIGSSIFQRHMEETIALARLVLKEEEPSAALTDAIHAIHSTGVVAKNSYVLLYALRQITPESYGTDALLADAAQRITAEKDTVSSGSITKSTAFKAIHTALTNANPSPPPPTAVAASSSSLRYNNKTKEARLMTKETRSKIENYMRAILITLGENTQIQHLLLNSEEFALYLQAVPTTFHNNVAIAAAIHYSLVGPFQARLKVTSYKEVMNAAISVQQQDKELDHTVMATLKAQMSKPKPVMSDTLASTWLEVYFAEEFPIHAHKYKQLSKGVVDDKSPLTLTREEWMRRVFAVEHPELVEYYDKEIDSDDCSDAEWDADIARINLREAMQMRFGESGVPSEKEMAQILNGELGPKLQGVVKQLRLEQMACDLGEILRVRKNHFQTQLARFPPNGLPSSDDLHGFMAGEGGPLLRTLLRRLAMQGELGDTQTLFPTQAQVRQINNTGSTIPSAMKFIANIIRDSMTPSRRAQMLPIQQNIECRVNAVDRKASWEHIYRLALSYKTIVLNKSVYHSSQAVVDMVDHRLDQFYKRISSKPAPPKDDPLSHESECVAATMLSASMHDCNNKLLYNSVFSPSHLCKSGLGDSKLVSQSTMSTCGGRMKKLLAQ